MLPKIGQVYQINRNEQGNRFTTWFIGEIDTGLVIEIDEQDIADMVDMKEYGPHYATFVKFLIGESTLWLPYVEKNFTRIL